MLKSLIKKYNVNVYSMLKNGTVAVITMFGVWILFGVKNIMIAFPIALTSTVLGRQNFYVKTFYKVIWLIILDMLIVVTSFISSLNLYTGIIINFISIFLIMYSIISQYDLTFYKPFIMLYIFTQYATVSFSELPERLYSVLFGVAVIVLASFIKKINEKFVLGSSIVVYINMLKHQVKNIRENHYSDELKNKCTGKMRDLTYKIYISRHRKYLTTNIGIIQFNLLINLEYLNLLLKDIATEKNIKEKELADIELLLDNFEKYTSGNIDVVDLKEKVEYFINDNINKSEIFELIGNIFMEVYKNLKRLAEMNKREINKVYKQWQRSDLDTFKNVFKEYFNVNSIRFKFAIRMAITLTIALLVGEFLGFYKIIWAIITIMSIMQPYYEDTITKARDRVKGNILAILVTGILINIVDNKLITILILIGALYLLYGFKEYYKISLFAAVASICVSSLTENINVLIFLRIIYVIAGVILVLIANKIIFPYRLKDGVRQLVKKIRRYNEYLMEDSKDYLNNNKNINNIRDVIIHLMLLMQKLNLRNMQYGDEGINRFIEMNNYYLIKISYETLFCFHSNRKNKYNIIKAYGEFNKSNMIFNG